MSGVEGRFNAALMRSAVINIISVMRAIWLHFSAAFKQASDKLTIPFSSIHLPLTSQLCLATALHIQLISAYLGFTS